MKPSPALLKTYATYPFQLVRAEGDMVFSADGRGFVDFYGGHCVCLTGHGHPKVADAVGAMAHEFWFYSTAAEIPVRERAARKLVDFAPEHITRVFFCNSGAEANDNALKLAVMLTGRKKFVAFDGAFHGRSAWCLAVNDTPKLSAPFAGMLPDVIRLPFGDVEALAKVDLSQVAAVILEPIQSTAGIVTASHEWFRFVEQSCRKSGAFLIFDEVQTAMGRLGAPFAAQFYGVAPDIMTTAKGIASGFPMGALLLPEHVASALKPGDMGSTFGGGPMACAALDATLDVVAEEGLVARAARLSGMIKGALAGTCVTRVRGEGLLLGLEVPGKAAALKQHLEESGILVGSSSNPDVLRLMPPLVIRERSVELLAEAIRAF